MVIHFLVWPVTFAGCIALFLVMLFPVVLLHPAKRQGLTAMDVAVCFMTQICNYQRCTAGTLACSLWRNFDITAFQVPILDLSKL